MSLFNKSFFPSLLLILTTWAIWYFYTFPQSFRIISENWAVSLTMVFGSFIAGATSEGGGAIAFPVFTKILQISPLDAKVFSLAIQSVGMTAATITIIVLRIKVEWRVIQHAPGANSNSKDPKQLENLKKTIWSIWPLSIRREGLINDYLQESNLSLHLTDIKVPTLVIHGTDDILVDISQGEAIARLVPNATMYVVEGGGHMMMSTHSEEIEKVIENFFQKTVVINL